METETTKPVIKCGRIEARQVGEFIELTHLGKLGNSRVLVPVTVFERWAIRQLRELVFS